MLFKEGDGRSITKAGLYFLNRCVFKKKISTWHWNTIYLSCRVHRIAAVCPHVMCDIPCSLQVKLYLSLTKTSEHCGTTVVLCSMYSHLQNPQATLLLDTCSLAYVQKKCVNMISWANEQVEDYSPLLNLKTVANTCLDWGEAAQNAASLNPHWGVCYCCSFCPLSPTLWCWSREAFQPNECGKNQTAELNVPTDSQLHYLFWVWAKTGWECLLWA